MALEKLSVQNARELVNYLIAEVITHVQCAVELQMQLVPHAVAQVKLVYTHEVWAEIRILSPLGDGIHVYTILLTTGQQAIQGKYCFTIL